MVLGGRSGFGFRQSVLHSFRLSFKVNPQKGLGGQQHARIKGRLSAEAAVPAGKGSDRPKEVHSAKIWPECFLEVKLGVA